MNGQVDYALCDQTVTVYHRQGDEIFRSVEEGCWFSRQTEQVTDVQGCRQETKCLLIMPGDRQRIFVGDRVFDGVGPVVDTDGWDSFIPVLVDGLAEISYVKPCYWDGTLCHVEAGRR